MYFDWCENPEELRKALGDLLSGTTFVRATVAGRGAHAVTMIGPNEDGILKQAFLEARNVAEKLCKRCPALPALPDTLCVPLEGMGRMLAWCQEAATKWVEPVPNTAGHLPFGKSEDLISKAGKVHGLLVRDSAVRERFREQDKLFWDKLKAWWQANEVYEAALRPFSEKVYRSKGKNKAKAEEELEKAEANLQPPGPCPVKWLQPPVGCNLPPNARNVMKRMFPDSRPPMTEETVRLRAYVLLTILHDHALKNEVSLIADENVWPRDDDDVPGDFALTAWKDMEANPSWSCGAIDRALHVVEADLDAFGLKPGGEEQPGTTANEQVRNQVQLTDTEENILEALGDRQMVGRVLLKEAGYDDSSHYRQILSNLVKRGILEKTGHGYRRARPACDPPTRSEDRHE